jgi:hypothetical protein
MKPVHLTSARTRSFVYGSSKAAGAGVISEVLPPLKRTSRLQEVHVHGLVLRDDLRAPAEPGVVLAPNFVGRRVELALEILERECDVEDVDVVLRDRLTARDAGHRGGRSSWKADLERG